MILTSFALGITITSCHHFCNDLVPLLFVLFIIVMGLHVLLEVANVAEARVAHGTHVVDLGTGRGSH